MWAIIKFDKKNLEFLKKNIKEKLGNEVEFYLPKIFIQKYKNNKLVGQELNLLGDYLFFSHEKLKNKETLNRLKFTKGLKYFLDGFANSQNEIKKFINKCKNFENKDGSISSNFFELKINEKYRFNSGPLLNLIFQLIEVQKKKLKILIGNKTTTVSKDILVCPL